MPDKFKIKFNIYFPIAFSLNIYLILNINIFNIYYIYLILYIIISVFYWNKLKIISYKITIT